MIYKNDKFQKFFLWFAIEIMFVVQKVSQMLPLEPKTEMNPNFTLIQRLKSFKKFET